MYGDEKYLKILKDELVKNGVEIEEESGHYYYYDAEDR